MKKAWTAAALAISAMAWSASGMAQHGNGDPPKCSPRTLNGSYVLAASGFMIVAGMPQPKAIIEQVDFNGDGSGFSPDSALAVNGDPVVINTSGGGVSYGLDGSCIGHVQFRERTNPLGPHGPGRRQGMDPAAVALQAMCFQGTLTRVWPPKDHDERH